VFVRKNKTNAKSDFAGDHGSPLHK